jgi:hypothetical protein
MPWAKIRGQPLRVAIKIGAGSVARLANMDDIRRTGRLAITNFDSQRTRVLPCQ